VFVLFVTLVTCFTTEVVPLLLLRIRIARLFLLKVVLNAIRAIFLGMELVILSILYAKRVMLVVVSVFLAMLDIR
jgi:hypothetical protein